MRAYSLALCLPVAALGLAACGSGDKTVTVERTVAQPPATQTGTASTPGRAPTTPSGAPTRIVRQRMFQSPSHNIGCAIYEAARCDIDKRDWPLPPRPAGCPSDSDFGQGLTVEASGPARVVCAGDTARDLRSPVLAYGTGSRVGSFLCVSSRSGITCTNRSTGHGFLISVERYRRF